jgi:hypothetical protein
MQDKTVVVAEDARRFFYNFAFYLIDRLLWNSVRYTFFRTSRNHFRLILRWCSSRHVESAVRRMMFNSELSERSVAEGTKAVRHIWSRKIRNDDYVAFRDP